MQINPSRAPEFALYVRYALSEYARGCVDAD